MRSTDRVREAAAAAGLPITVRDMPASTRTAEDAAAACGVEVGRIVKSLVFRTAGGEPLLVLVSGANQVEPDALAAEIGERIDRMDARAVRDLTGFAIGGVAPIGSSAPLRTLIDRDLLQFETVWAAAGAPQSVFEASPRALAAAAKARIVAVRRE